MYSITEFCKNGEVYEWLYADLKDYLEFLSKNDKKFSVVIIEKDDLKITLNFVTNTLRYRTNLF